MFGFAERLWGAESKAAAAKATAADEPTDESTPAGWGQLSPAEAAAAAWVQQRRQRNGR